MKKLILIFSLLLSSINVSAELLKDNNFIKSMRQNAEAAEAAGAPEVSLEQLAQESFDTYETFLEFNAQQDIDNPTGSRVSEDLMNNAKKLAMYDVIQYAIIETFEAAIARDETIKTEDPLRPEDKEDGINAAQKIIGPLVDNPVFSVDEQALMRGAVTRYLGIYQIGGMYENALYEGASAWSIISSLGGMELFYAGDYDPRGTMEAAKRFGRNHLSTFFAIQNGVQSTCLGYSCAKPD